MILALTPNPALDLTYEVDQVRTHTEHRVRRVRSEPGGKGVNVARVLAQLGRPSICAGPLGGTTGAEIGDLLRAHDGVRQAWTPIAGTTRRTVTVVAPDGATGFHEPGPTLCLAERAALVADLTALLTSACPLVSAVTLSGSLPPGLNGDDLAQLVDACRTNARPVLVDTSGPALLAAARAGADVLKPNAAEALAATGARTPLQAALVLLEMGAGAVVCSLGPEGMLGVRQDHGSARAWRARLAEPITGNPTGAGDSVVAVLAAIYVVDRAELPEALRHAVAVSASAVTSPVAGEIDLQLAEALIPDVEIQEIPCP